MTTTPVNWREEIRQGPSLSVLLDLVFRPTRRIRRIIETVHVNSEALVRTITLEISAEDGQLTLVPLLRPERGELVDNLQLLDAVDERPQLTLNRQEGQLLSVLMLAFLCRHVIARAKLGGWDPAGTFVASSEVSEAIRAVSSAPTGSTEKARQDVQRLLSTDWTHHPGLTASDRSYSRAMQVLAQDPEVRSLVTFLAERRLIIYPTRAIGSSIKVTYSYEGRHQEAVSENWRGLVRTVLGHSPYDFRFEIPNHDRAPSYHFRLRAPDGNYLRTSELQTVKYRFGGTHNRVPHDWALARYRPAGKYATVEGEGRSTGNYAHIYIANYRQAPTGSARVFARVVINEKPGGTIGAVVLQLALVLASLGTVVFLGEKLAGNPASAETPALLLAVPGVIALLERSRSESHLLLTPLSARLGGLIAVLCSFLGALAFVALACLDPVSDHDLRNILWLALKGVVVVAALALGWTSVRLCLNLWRYRAARRAYRGLLSPESKP